MRRFTAEDSSDAHPELIYILYRYSGNGGLVHACFIFFCNQLFDGWQALKTNKLQIRQTHLQSLCAILLILSLIFSFLGCSPSNFIWFADHLIVIKYLASDWIAPSDNDELSLFDHYRRRIRLDEAPAASYDHFNKRLYLPESVTVTPVDKAL